MTRITITAALALVAFTGTAFADKVLVDETHRTYEMCSIANGILLNGLIEKGLRGEVLVNINPVYLAKVKAPGVSVILGCENGHQTVVAVGK